MRRILRYLCSTAVCCCAFSLIRAQNDSTWLDAGNIRIRRDFASSIRIRGEELEKMPFTHLSDAITAWLYGAYSDRNTLAYVVDGNLVSDVNLYSAYDIAEVVFVANAIVQVNTGYSQQQVVLITTRKKAQGQLGLTLATQLAGITKDFNDQPNGKSIHSTTKLYQQYHAGFGREFGKFSFGVSADFQKDMNPDAKADSMQINTPYHLDRWRLNGQATWRPDANNELSLNLAYAPQNTIAYNKEYGNKPYPNIVDSVLNSGNSKQHVIIPVLGWRSKFGSHWSNSLQASYVNTDEKSTSEVAQELNEFNPPEYFAFIANLETRVRQFYARDHLSYSAMTGNWSIVPSVNLAYNNYKEDLYLAQATFSGSNGQNINYSTSHNQYKGNTYMVTPAIDLAYKRQFQFQAGALFNLSKDFVWHDLVNGGRRIFPFATATVDFLRWNKPDNAASLQLSASYAMRTAMTFTNMYLGDIAPTGNAFLLSPFYSGTSTGLTLPFFTPPAYWVWDAGLQWKSRDQRVQAHYNYEARNYLYGAFTTAYPYTSNYAKLQSAGHYAGLSVRILDKGGLQWQTAINAAILVTRDYSAVNVALGKPVGDLGKGNTSVSGGWTNVFRVGDFSLGLNLVCHFKEPSYLDNGTAITVSRNSSVLLQMVYAAYRVQVAKTRPLEFFIDSRNLLQSDKSDLSDHRRYFGLGGKISI